MTLMLRMTLGLLLLSVTSLATAAIQTFTDHTAFTNSLGSVEVYGFDAFQRTDGMLGGVGFDFLDQDIPGLDFDNSIVYFGGQGGTSNSAPNVILNEDLVNPIVIRFDTPRHGVGLFNTSLVDAERFEVYDIDDNLLGAIDLPAAIINFGGFISDTPIARAVVLPLAPTNGSIYIDDLTISAIPLPAAFWLFAPTFAALSLFRRKLKVRQ